MEEQGPGSPKESGKEKRQSVQSLNSAMQRVADRLIATTESFRTQLRERETESRASRSSDSKSDGPSQPTGEASGSPPAETGPEATQAQTQLPFATDSSGATSTEASISRPSDAASSPLLMAELPVAVSTPQLVEAQPQEPTSAHIDRVTSSSSSDDNPPLTRPAPPFTADSAQASSSRADSARSDLDASTPKQSFFQSSVSNVREPFLSGADRAVTSRATKRTTLMSQLSDGRPSFSLFREVLFIGVVCSSQLLHFAAFAQALAPAQSIGASFPATEPGLLSWYTAAYALGAAAFALPAGRLASLLGHKKMFVGGFAWFALWSTVAGASVYVRRGGGDGATVFFCVCRAMQGIAAAMTVPSGQVMLGSVYGLGPRRNLAMCLFWTSAPLGLVLGAVMASLFAELASWEWAFFVLGAVCLTLACQSMLVLPPDPPIDPAIQRQQLWKLIDFPGIVLGVSGLVLFVFAWNQAPVVSWTIPYVYFLLIMGVLFLGAFLYVERSARYPLLPRKVINPTTTVILTCVAAGWGCFAIWAYYTFQFLTVLRDWNPLLASAGFAHTPVVGLIASIFAAYLLRRVTPYWVLLASMLFFALSAALMATAPVGQTYWINSFLSIFFAPLGINMSQPVATILVANSLPAAHQDMAGSLVFTAVFTSVSVSLGVAGTVVSNVGEDSAGGYRGALYVAVGLAGVGSLLALAAAVCDTLWPPEPEEGAVLRFGAKAEKRPAEQPLVQGMESTSPA